MVYRKLNIVERLLFLVPTIVIFLPTSLTLDLIAIGVCIFAFMLARRGRPITAVT
jgi:hypothetical protein